MMDQLAASVTAQAATVATLSTNINGGSSGTGKTTDNNKSRPGLHVCAHCTVSKKCTTRTETFCIWMQIRQSVTLGGRASSPRNRMI